MALGMQVGLGPVHIVLDGNTAPLPKKGQSPQFWAHVCCDQTAGRIKIALGMDVGLDPGHIVLDEDPAPLPKKGSRAPQIFGPFLLHGQIAVCNRIPPGTEVDLSSLGDIALDGDQAYPPLKGHSIPNFRPLSVVAKRLDGLRCHLVLGMEVGLGPGDVVLDGVAAPLKRGTDPQFSSHVYCGQTA